MLAPKEEISLLKQFNENKGLNLAYKKPSTSFISLFLTAVKNFPDNRAIVYKDITYTYDQIDKETDALCFFLQKKGAVTGPSVTAPFFCKKKALLQMALLVSFLKKGLNLSSQ